MHIPARNIIVSPPFTRHTRQSLIDMNPPYVSEGPMANYVARWIPQQGITQSICEPHS